MDFKRPLKPVWHSGDIERAEQICRRKRPEQAAEDGKARTEKPPKRGVDTTLTGKQGLEKMARFEVRDIEMAVAGGQSRADVFCNLGLIYATGRGCPVDLIAAHKWLNIAAIKGSERAASLRADLARNMTKADLATALRAARDWMTAH